MELIQLMALQDLPLRTRRLGIRWSGSSLEAFAGGVLGSAGSYDGSFNLTTIGIAPSVECTIKDVAIWQTSISNQDILDVSASSADCVVTSSLSSSILDNYTKILEFLSEVSTSTVINSCKLYSSVMSSTISSTVNLFDNYLKNALLTPTPSISSVINSCKFHLSNLQPTLSTIVTLLDNYTISKNMAVAISTDYSINSCKFYTSNLHTPISITSSILNNYTKSTNMTITVNTNTSYIIRGITYNLQLDAEYSIPVISIRYSIN